MRTTTDLLLLRWRVAQWFLALSDGRKEEATALVKAMNIEGAERADILDEYKLLRAQFGNRQRYHLVGEISRLWRKIQERCSRCEQPSDYLDNAGICWVCILDDESS